MRMKNIQFLSVRITAIISGSVLLMVFFQNCGKAGFDSQNAGGIDLSSKTSVDTTVPFAFEAAFDEISYNSCAVATLAGHPEFYSIKAGAYSSAGVQMTTDFKNSTRSQAIIRTDDGGPPSIDQVKLYLASTGMNKAAAPQFAMRTRTNVQQIRNPGGTVPAEGLDFITMLGSLTDDRWMDPIVRYSGYTYFFSLAPDANRSLEATLTYNKDEGTSQGLRNDMGSNGMFALTFKDPNLVATGARVPPNTTDTRMAYGKGYLPTFEAAIAPYTTALEGTAAIPNVLNPNNILTTLREIDLTNPTAASGKTWTCDPNRRYLVVKQNDAATYCPPDPYSYMTNASYRAEYELVRRHLKPEDWQVSIRYRCVVPKGTTSCYATQTAAGAEPLIEYDQTQPCFQTVSGIPYGTPRPTKYCAQYVSFCNRN